MKKKHLVLLTTLLCSIGIYSFISFKTETRKIPYSPPAPSTNNNIWDKFLLGAMCNETDPEFTNNYSNSDSVEFNINHRYTGVLFDSVLGKETPRGRTTNDSLNAHVGRYRDEVRAILDKAYLQGGMRSIVSRPKIEWLCYGQSSTYECETVSHFNYDLWFYTFNNHDVGADAQDSGKWVRYCGIPSGETEGGPGYVVRRLKANTEQSYRATDSTSATWRGDSRSTWYIKPKIRASKTYINNNPDSNICRITVLEADGINIKREVILKGRNFWDANDNYDGQYLENFTNLPSNNNLSFTGDLGNSFAFTARGTSTEDWTTNQLNYADIKVYWYGKCDMWIDYVKVENDVAKELFSGQWDTIIEQEVTEIGMHIPSGASEYSVLKFYVELLQFNNLPCVKYVNDIIKATSGNAIDLMYDFTDFTLFHVSYGEMHNVTTPRWIYENIIQKAGFSQFFAETYPMTSSYKDGTSFSGYFSKIPSTLPLPTNRDTILADTAAPETYDTWLQHNLNDRSIFTPVTAHTPDENPYLDRPQCTAGGELKQFEGYFSFIMKLGNAIQHEYNIPFISMPQVHHWYVPWEVRREPTNEEIDMLANTIISYGAKGFIYFWFQSIGGNQTIGGAGCPYISKGIVDMNNNLIRKNLYGQAKDKWKVIRDISQRVKKWEPYIMNFSHDKIKSCIYDKESDRGIILDGYFNNVVTFKPGSNTPPCDISDAHSGTTPECPDERYVQVATFEKSGETNIKYFMIVNRRCSPVDSVHADGKRFITVNFDSNAWAFSGFNNWKIIDLENDATVLTFDKRTTSNLDLGWFEPGQGKLYRVVPVMIWGGALESNEEMSNVTFDLDTTINANGKNITLGAGVNINFKTNGKIQMSGGNFKCGTVSEAYNAPKSVNLHAQSGMKWGGIVLENMDTVHIQNTEVKDVDSDTNNHKYGISLVNTKVINIDNCNIFNTNSSAAGIQVNYVTNLYMSPDISITGNTIKINTDTCSGIYIHPYSWLTLTPYIYGNKIINTSSGGGETGIFGFSLEGAPIKNNYIENFQHGIMTWYSSLDLFENTITTLNISNGWDLYGIVSEYNLSNAYESRLGGSNVLTTLDGRNICLDALDLNLTDGNNIFNINDEDGYHLKGYYPTTPPPGDPQPTNAMGNCFQIEGIPVTDESYIRENVTWANATAMEFDYSNPICPESPNYCNYYIGGNPNDTVWIECAGGIGGGQKDNYKLSAPQENVYKQIYDSLSINMRKRQYELAAQKCMTLLNNYPDSAKTINAVDKLYHTALARDEVSELKSYFESFIQSHPNHTHIIQRMFYYIQKTKAKLGQYESAMQGFQTIMNQFPTSYEGLAAKWDYMATQLLDSLSGQGGGDKETISDDVLTDEQRHERLVSLVEDPLDKYDKKKFTKEDRKVIVNNIVNSFEDKKMKETKRVKELEVKVFMNEATKSEKQEYKTKKVLKEVVRPQTVNTISEHIKVVQSDIERVFDVGKNTKDADNKTVAVIPLEYKLNQNYPNPFNPSTKINYELKNAGYVSLKIYDLLGREIAELVNETKDAGRYSIDFNASKYMMASGIYFYRIKAGEFVDTKRMVLVK